jgi:hypothetical protein
VKTHRVALLRKCRGALSLGACAVLACQPGSGDRQTLEQIGYDPKYRTLTAELLAQEPDSTLEWAVIQHVTWRIDEAYDREREIVMAMSPGLRMVYTTWGVEAEVNNGGFSQYFENSSGRLADEALAGFRRLGATSYAGLLERAMAARQAGNAAAYDALDTEFYTLAGLAAARVRYIREHPGEFVGP